mgnify:CR=1 FL=1
MLPSEFDVLCTHPMFGPQSGKESWKNLPFVYEKVRIGKGNREDRCTRFLDIFANEVLFFKKTFSNGSPNAKCHNVNVHWGNHLHVLIYLCATNYL